MLDRLDGVFVGVMWLMVEFSRVLDDAEVLTFNRSLFSDNRSLFSDNRSLLFSKRSLLFDGSKRRI